MTKIKKKKLGVLILIIVKSESKANKVPKSRKEKGIWTQG